MCMLIFDQIYLSALPNPILNTETKSCMNTQMFMG